MSATKPCLMINRGAAMKIKYAILVGAAVVAIILVAMATVIPTLDYGPPIEGAPSEVRETAQTVVAALERCGRLPSPGTQLVRRNSVLEWDTIDQSAPEVIAVQVSRIRLASGAPLLANLLDDDPIYSAEAEVMVTTSDQRETMLRLTLWDYGLLTPWSIRNSGDGLKPVRVLWN